MFLHVTFAIFMHNTGIPFYSLLWVWIYVLHTMCVDFNWKLIMKTGYKINTFIELVVKNWKRSPYFTPIRKGKLKITWAVGSCWKMSLMFICLQPMLR